MKNNQNTFQNYKSLESKELFDINGGDDGGCSFKDGFLPGLAFAVDLVEKFWRWLTK